MDTRTAARILDLADAPSARGGSRSRALAIFSLSLLLAAHAAPRSGFPDSAQSAAMSPAGAGSRARESDHMKRLMAIGAAAVVAGSALAQDAVQWRVEDGGNGHWYARVLITTQMSRTAFVAAADALGGQSVSLSSNAEELFVFSQLGDGFLGLSATAGSSAFTWMTDPSNAYSNWGGRGCDWGPYPNNPLAAERFAWLQSANCFGTQGTQILWDDFQPSELPPTVPIIIEWSADCNADGLVDYGQILAGELTDANANNIPDCCEGGGSCNCQGDTNNDRSVDGIDLATILTRWGQPGAKFPAADCNNDGVIDGVDLAVVLAGWGGCS